MLVDTLDALGRRGYGKAIRNGRPKLLAGTLRYMALPKCVLG